MDLQDVLMDLLENKFKGNKQKFTLSILNSKEYSGLRNSIISTSSFLFNPSWTQRIYHIINNSMEIPKCYCGYAVKFFDLSKGYNKYCSRSCQFKDPSYREKIEKTNLGRYGTKTPGENQDIKNKVKKTNLERYGFESHNQSESVKEKKKIACFEHFGVENPSLSIVVQEKRKNTFIERFGVENPNMNEEIKNRKKEYFLEKYGEICPSKDSAVKEKMKKTNMVKYGTEVTSKNLVVKEKMIQTNINKYGVPYTSQVRKFTTDKSYERLFGEKGKYFSLVFPLFTKEEYDGQKKGSEYSFYNFNCKKCLNTFEDHLVFAHAPRCPFCFPLQSSSISEKQVSEYLTSLNIAFEEKNRSIIPPLELDIYIPDYKLAIEFNGLYWHSEIGSKKFYEYHLGKTNKCLEKGIQLIHIFEDEWINKQKTVKSIILSKLGLNTKISGRDTEYKEVNKEEGNNFLEANHIQGNSIGINKYFGLFYNNELMQLLGIGKSRYNKNYDYELIRSCTKLNTTVIGGFEKLMKNLPLQGKIISYVDRRYFNGNSYKEWAYINKTNPNYFYMKDYRNRESRLKYQKHKLPKLFPDVYDKDLTEWEIMQLAGYDRIWDCGNLVYSRTL